MKNTNANHSAQGEFQRVSFITISDDEAGQRVDNYLIRILKGLPKSMVYRIIRKGEVRVNKKRIKAEYKLVAGDVLRIPPVRFSEQGAPKVSAAFNQVQQLASAIIHEDDALIVLNKPSGLAVHAGSGIDFGIIEALRVLRPENRYLELIHRIDRGTSGCLLIAKKRSALRALHKQLREKTARKHYLCLVQGSWPEELKQIDSPLMRQTLASGEMVVRVHPEGKPSLTRFRVVQLFKDSTLIQASPVTGRTHQIRVHTASVKQAIAGDDKYGDSEFDKRMLSRGLKRLFLHAHKIAFDHPISGERVEYEAPLSSGLEKVLKKMS